jgi:hypothetical protein
VEFQVDGVTGENVQDGGSVGGKSVIYLIEERLITWDNVSKRYLRIW